MSGTMCNDNRFDLIAKYKAKLIEATNIETSPEEMAVLDSILFRMWQMGWLDRLEQPTASPWHRVEEPPKEYGTYVVCWKDGEKFWWEKADWDEDWCTEEPSWYSFRDGRATIIKPDYWMPIEPPKEDA